MAQNKKNTYYKKWNSDDQNYKQALKNGVIHSVIKHKNERA